MRAPRAAILTSAGIVPTVRIGVLTGGGDCPGLNAVIRAIVRRGIDGHGLEIVGFRDGWRGPGLANTRGPKDNQNRPRGTPLAVGVRPRRTERAGGDRPPAHDRRVAQP